MKKYTAKQVLVTIATTKRSDWKNKIKEADKLKLKTIALFLSAAEKPEREKIYEALKKSRIKQIPFVHIRGDMTPDELCFLMKEYKTKVFNIHTLKQHPLKFDYSKYLKNIAIENSSFPFDESELRAFGGICLDVSHLEDDRLLYMNAFLDNSRILKKYPIVCNHISAMGKRAKKDPENGKFYYNIHSLESISQLDYLKNYPLSYFSNYIAIELENSLKEQLEIRKYIISLLNRKINDKNLKRKE